MNYLKLFTITTIELVCIIILFSAFNKNLFGQTDKYIIKRSLIVVLFSIFLLLLNIHQVRFTPLINYACLIVLMALVFRINIFLCLAQFSISVLAVFLLQFIGITSLKYTLSSMDINSNFTSIFLMNAFIAILCLIIHFSKLPVSIIDTFSKKTSMLYFIVFNIVIYLFTISILMHYNIAAIFDNLTLLTLIPIVFIGGNFIYISYKMKLKEHEESLDCYNKYMPIITELLEESRRRQHDFKNHLNTLTSIMEHPDEADCKAEVESYISSLTDSFADIEGLLHIKNKVIAAIIYNKVLSSRKLNVTFEYIVNEPESSIYIKNYELSELLNNLLDNAIHAVQTDAGEESKVFLYINYEKNALCIKVSNTSSPIKPEIIKKLFTRGFSTKKSINHGYGLSTVKSIIDAYNGSIEISYENNCNVFSIKI